MMAAKIANEITQDKVDDLIKKLVRIKIPLPINKPMPSIASGDILPREITAINVINRKTPQVIPNAIPNNHQSIKMVKEDNNVPINTQ